MRIKHTRYATLISNFATALLRTPTWPARSACDQPIRWRPAFGGQDYRAASWGHLAWTTFASPETISLNPSREFPMASADIGRMTMSPWRSRMKSSRDILSRSPMAASRGLWPDFRADLPRTQRDGSGRSVARAKWRWPGHTIGLDTATRMLMARDLPPPSEN